jgi:ABC-2 type transport system permease protein
MSKALVVAIREYVSAVKSKGFIIGVVLMPVMMCAGIIAQRVSQRIADTNTYVVAVLDRTPGEVVLGALEEANARRTEKEIFEATTQPAGDATTRKQVKPRFEFRRIEPAPRTDAKAIDEQRLALSEQCRKGELLAFVEVGENVTNGQALIATTQIADAAAKTRVDANAGALASLLDARSDDVVVRYTTNRPTFDDFKRWLTENMRLPIHTARMQDAGLDMSLIAKVNETMLASSVLQERGLATRKADGSVDYAADKAGQITAFLVPFALLMLMFVVVFTGASPMATNVLEEKQMRIAEVLLGGLTPFQLMLGKLIGGVGVALTLAAIYLGGTVAAAYQFNALQYIQPSVLAAFIVFTILAVFMYGGVFLAAGAAVTNVKEVQAIIGPVMLLIIGPLAMFGQIIKYPNGMLAQALTYFPPTSPMITVTRSAIPPGLSLWELMLGAISSLIGTIAIVWIAGRIFRIGLLSNSRPNSIKETIAWITKG